MISLTLTEAMMDLLNMAAGLVILTCCLLAWEAMSARTRHCFRFVYGVMGVAGLAMALIPWWPGAEPEWMRVAHVALAVAIAIHMVLDRRRIDRVRQPGGAVR